LPYFDRALAKNLSGKLDYCHTGTLIMYKQK